MKDRLILLLKGIAMGGADVIPGVSGGTIALITGIYEELIRSLKAIDASVIPLLFSFRIKELWQQINGNFLIILFVGIGTSIFSLAKLITHLMLTQPIALWSFFFGLIIISSFYVLPAKRGMKEYVSLGVGIVIAFIITTLTPANTPESLWFIFVSGAVAICAMILPGISGSFILLLLGKYEYMLEAVKSFDLVLIVVFVLGCLLGLISFSKLLHWLLKNHRGVTLSVLAGFMLGSLNKIWPWKIPVGDRLINATPGSFETVSGSPNQLPIAITFMIIGVILVILLEKLGTKMTTK